MALAVTVAAHAAPPLLAVPLELPPELVELVEPWLPLDVPLPREEL
jgi:hypothetical protein